jgi:hypothetical protein
VRHIQPTFSGGEFSPSLYARVDVQKYAAGLKTAKNFIIHPHGGASNRPGTRLVHATKDPLTTARLIPFEFSSQQAYVIEFGDNYCRFYMDGGIILNGGVPYEIATPYGHADLPYLCVTQSADVLYIFHPDHAPRMLTRYDHTDWELSLFPFSGGPFMPSNIDSAFTVAVNGVSGTGKTMTASKDLFEAGHVGALFQVSHDMTGEAKSGTHSVNFTSDAVNCSGGWRLFVKGSFSGTVKLWYSTDNWVSQKLLRQYTNADVNASGTMDEFCQLKYEVVWGSGTSVTVDLNTDPYTRSGVVKVVAVSNARTATVDVLSTLAATAATADWAEGSWSPKNGYPAVAGFYQDRLCCARTPAEPQTIWASQTGGYTDFSRSTPLEDTDGISINLPSYKVNGVNAIVPLGDILAMTSSAEWSVGAGPDGAFTPTSMQTRCHGYRGCSRVQPVIIGNRVIYVLPSGAIVRDFGYDYTANGYAGNNLSVFSSHLLEGFSVVDMVYQQEPDSIVWMVRSDGKLLALTYLMEQEVVAWTRHETDGQVESVCCIPGDGYDELWMVVKRGDSRFVERMERRSLSDDPAEQFFVDCGLTYRGDPATVISGLDHLEGREVVVLADGNVKQGMTVTDGQIELEAAASVVHVGLPYVSDLETLNMEIPLRDGTMQGRKVHVSELVVRFLRSRGGWIGPDADNLDEITQRSSEPLGAPIALFTGDYPATVPAEQDNGGRIFIRQRDPLPMTVLAIIASVDFGA